MAPKTAPAPWRSRIVGTGTEAPDQLVANPRNWRTHPGPQRDALRGSLDSVGWVQQVMVNRVTGHVVDGHARVEEALSRGEAAVPVLYVELTEEEEALVLATLDPIGAMAATDADRLTALLAEVGDHDAGLDALLASLAPEVPIVGLTDPDAVPDVADDGGVRRGDIYALGDHRLMCGDATDGLDIALLVEGVEAALLLTDPPYGLDRNLARAAGRERRIANDDPQSAPVMYAALDPFRDVPERYVWGQWNTWQNLVDALGMPDNCIVWVKTNMGMGHGYRHRHEFCAYYGSRSFADQSDVWEAARDYSGIHPTVKPVDLFERTITNSSERDAVVVDPFVGSGTTIIAAERTGRRCYAMEVEPRYVAVSIRRWEEFTGRKAEKIDGPTDEALA